MDGLLPGRYVDVTLLTSHDNRRVFRCRNEETGEWLAVKCIDPVGDAEPSAQGSLDEDTVEAFRAEYLRLEAIDHPNWVRPGRFFALPDGGYGFELELSSGRPLLEIPWRGWCPEIAEIIRQILSGLHTLHVMGMAHLDLKPEQVLVEWGDGDGGEGGVDDIHVHLLDLGFSCAFGTSIQPTGTAGYMAPELHLEARGGQEELIWLLNGRQIGRVPAGHTLRQRFSDAGRYRITVMDDAGRYDRVDISVR